MPPPATALVDGTPFLYRAEFGFPTRILNRAGQDITGLFGTLALLRKSLRSAPFPVVRAVVVFDADAPLARAQDDRRYKSARTGVAPENNPFRHLQTIKHGLEIWGIPVVEHESAEADDVIATLVRRWAGDTAHQLLISPDKDLHQLLGDRVVQWDPARGCDRGLVTDKLLRERQHIEPEQWPDYLALVGDRSDGLPGVRGVGPVNARRLLRDGRRLEDVPTGELSAEDRRAALAQRRLHLLDHSIPLPGVTAARLRPEELIDAARVLEILNAWDWSSSGRS